MAITTNGTAMSIQQQMEMERYKQEAMYKMAAMAQNMEMGTYIGTGAANAVVQAQTQMAPSTPKENGVLYLKGKPLPDDWSGAKITSYKRDTSADGTVRWRFTFLSKWSDEQRIELFLDAETMSGEEARKVADTYMEALNQRRSG